MQPDQQPDDNTARARYTQAIFEGPLAPRVLEMRPPPEPPLRRPAAIRSALIALIPLLRVCWRRRSLVPLRTFLGILAR